MFQYRRPTTLFVVDPSNDFYPGACQMLATLPMTCLYIRSVSDLHKLGNHGDLQLCLLTETALEGEFGRQFLAMSHRLKNIAFLVCCKSPDTFQTVATKFDEPRVLLPIKWPLTKDNLLKAWCQVAQFLRKCPPLDGDILNEKRPQVHITDSPEFLGPNQHLLFSILNYTEECIFVLNRENQFVLINRGGEQLVQKKGPSVHTIFDLPQQELRIAFTGWLQEVESATGKVTVQLEHISPVTKEKTFFQGSVSRVYDGDGEMIGTLVLLRDATLQMQNERLKDEFLATAAHELRSPITEIQGYSELLLNNQDLPDHKRKRFVDRINRQSRHLSTLVSDLLDISKIEAGIELSVQMIPNNFVNLVKEVVESAQQLSNKHTIRLKVPDQMELFYFDYGRFSQVIQNLISNAVKYSPNGGTVTVQVGQSGNTAFLKISDQGIGMSPDQTKRIFEKFYRANASSSAIEGTGLGLTIVKHIVDQHGGEISVESALGNGTTMTVKLPMINARNLGSFALAQPSMKG